MNDQSKILMLALRLCGYSLSPELVTLAWELTKLVNEKGDLATIQDIAKIEVQVNSIFIEKSEEKETA